MIKIRLALIGIVFLLILLGFAFVKMLALKSSLTKANDYKSLYETRDTENKVWKDQSGYWRNRAETVEITKDNLGVIRELSGLSAQFEGLKKNMKNLENYIQASSSTTINKTIYLTDTSYIGSDSIRIKAQAFSYADKFDTIQGLVKKGTVDIKIKHRDKLDIVQYWDRKWFLGKKKTLIEIKSENPNTTVDYSKNIKVKRKRGLFHL